jgi:hypothetical protein
VPALVVGVLMIVALWKVGAPVSRPTGAAAPPPVPQPPLTELDAIAPGDAIGRRALLERVRISAIPSARTLWLGDGDHRVFAVLDPDVKRSHEARVVEGAAVTLVGLVRPVPAAETATRQWGLDADTAAAIGAAGVYVHVTEIRPAG